MEQQETPTARGRQAIAHVVALLEGARLAADATSGGDQMSAWANVSMSAHLAGAVLQRFLQWPQEPRIVEDCYQTLATALSELDRLDGSVGVPMEDLVFVRTWLSSALRDAKVLGDP